MVSLDVTLKLDRCPHCSVDKPNLSSISEYIHTSTDTGDDIRIWRIYKCARCGGLVTANTNQPNRIVYETFPSSFKVNDILPAKVKAYLQQAIDSVFAPVGSVMLCASAVDAMLKEKGYKEGNLYTRINKASKEGLITPEMGIWAHQVRLDANGQRHSDEEAVLPTTKDAKQSIEFTKTLAEFLFVLPSKVRTGIETTTKPKENTDIEQQ